MIDEQGNQLGIIETREALLKARELGLDLVEVAPQSKPPVCRIMDYGKFKYEQKRKERKATSHKPASELKILRIRTPKISPHDLEIKVNHARGFLQRGDRVQFTLRFSGREMMHQDIGRGLLATVKSSLADIAKVEQDCRMEGRMMSVLLSSTVKPQTSKPKPSKPPRPKEAPAEAAPTGAAEQPAPAAASDPVAQATPAPPAAAGPAPESGGGTAPGTSA